MYFILSSPFFDSRYHKRGMIPLYELCTDVNTFCCASYNFRSILSRISFIEVLPLLFTCSSGLCQNHIFFLLAQWKPLLFNSVLQLYVLPDTQIHEPHISISMFRLIMALITALNNSSSFMLYLTLEETTSAFSNKWKLISYSTLIVLIASSEPPLSGWFCFTSLLYSFLNSFQLFESFVEVCHLSFLLRFLSWCHNITIFQWCLLARFTKITVISVIYLVTIFQLILLTSLYISDIFKPQTTKQRQNRRMRHERSRKHFK